MLLRSSSTPLLGSLLSSSSAAAAFPETPSFADPFSIRRLPFPSPNLHVGIRRVQSEGNIAGRRASSLAVHCMGSSADEEEAPLFLARGLGIDGRIWPLGFPPLAGDGSGGCMGGGGGGGGGYQLVTGYGEEKSDLETFLKKMVEEHPCDALFMRNYAQFLYKTKKDLRKAEEYYSRAILLEPGDGETLADYGKLILEHYHDYDRASQYFNLAIQASPDDCYVLAAHAHFLWADGDDGGMNGQAHSHGLMVSAAV